MITVDDPGDPRIAAYRDIRERDLVGRRGHFVAEGEVVLRILIESAPHETVSVLIAEKRAAALAPLLTRLPAEVPVYLAPQAVLDTITGFNLHRGILALGRRRPPPGLDAFLDRCPGRAVIAVLYGIANHDNIGGIFRNAAAFGLHGIVLDATSCDPLYRKAIRVSVGATLTVPFARLDPESDGIKALNAHGFTPVAFSPAGTAMLSDLRPPPARAALLFGAEGPGLPPALLARTRTVAIPMAAGFDSLNVATASGIAFHHFMTER